MNFGLGLGLGDTQFVAVEACGIRPVSFANQCLDKRIEIRHFGPLDSGLFVQGTSRSSTDLGNLGPVGGMGAPGHKFSRVSVLVRQRI